MPRSPFGRVVVIVAASVLSLSPISGLAQGNARSTPIDAPLVYATVDVLGAVIQREYFDVDVSERVNATLHESLTRGRYDGIASAEALADAVNRDLYAMTHDRHLAVSVVYDPPASTEQTTAQAEQARAAGARRANYGIRQVEILPGNVGYFDLSSFFRPEEARDALATAMHLLRAADALIIDMRNNSGGSPATVTLLVSYILDQPSLHLLDIIHRPPEPTDHYDTEPNILADAEGQRPVYVLTAARTFSAGEGLAFILQERHRAEIIGETTAGAANPGRPYPVNDRFSVVVPNGRIRSAIGGGNWEGVGVTPDVKTPAAEALRVAYRRVLNQLLDGHPPGAWRDVLEQALLNVDSVPQR